MKKLNFSILAAFLAISSAAVAYTPYGTNSNDSKAAKYYRGEISSDEYLDHLGVPKSNPQNRGTVRGEFRKNDIGSGYSYRDSSGRNMEYHPNPYGGYDVYSNE